MSKTTIPTLTDIVHLGDETLANQLEHQRFEEKTVTQTEISILISETVDELLPIIGQQLEQLLNDKIFHKLKENSSN